MGVHADKGSVDETFAGFSDLPFEKGEKIYNAGRRGGNLKTVIREEEQDTKEDEQKDS